MEDYYASIFFLLIFLQDQFKGFITTVVCLIMAKSSAFGIAYLQSVGCSFYEACMFYEAIVFSVSIFLIGCRVGVILCVVSVISFFLNFVGYLLPEQGSFYQWYYHGYGFLNIILFEVLVWTCLINSRVKPYILKINMSRRTSNVVDNN